MHVYFSGIGGAGIGPLALVAEQAGYRVSGSDKQNSDYISYLHDKGIKRISIGQKKGSIAELHKREPIDWLVYSSAIKKENANHPELEFAKENKIKLSKRDEFINELLKIKNQKMIAVAGTHGKSTTAAMIIWIFKQLNIPISYSVGAKLSYGDMGEFDKKSNFFIYEADEYDRNFLSFHPEMSVISGIGYDHQDIYPTADDYNQAFNDFVEQSDHTIIWAQDATRINVSKGPNLTMLPGSSSTKMYELTGNVNRSNAHVAVVALEKLGIGKFDDLVRIINKFPGLSRRFEQIAKNIYSDYAHTPEKIRGALQMAREHAGKKVVVVYEGLHNTRQHFIKKSFSTLFTDAKKLYIVPSYLAREDKTLEMLTPQKLSKLIKMSGKKIPSKLDNNLKISILQHVEKGDFVLCLSAGGSGSLDEWLRKEFKN